MKSSRKAGRGKTKLLSAVPSNLQRMAAFLLWSFLAISAWPSPDLDEAQLRLFERYGGAFVETLGTRTHYFEFGDPSSATTLLYLHGFGGTGLEASLLAPYFVEEGYRILAPDWPGVGLSESLPVYSIEALVDWVEAFRSSLGLDTVILLGHSLGGYLSFHYASSHPEAVESLVLIDPAAFRGELGVLLTAMADSPFIVDLAAALYSPWYYSFFSSLSAYKVPSRVPKGLLDYAAAAMGTAAGREGLKDVTRGVVAAMRDIEKSEAPPARTLLIWAVEDRVLPYSWRERVLAALPEGTAFYPVRDCGHAPQMEKPEESAEAILAFLSGG